MSELDGLPGMLADIDESVQAGQILEVTLWTPDVAAGCGGRLAHQRTQQVGTRRR